MKGRSIKALSFLLSVMFLFAMSTSAFARMKKNTQCKSLLSTEAELVEKYFNLVKYKTSQGGLKTPYLDINPRGKKTVVLFAGFSHSMLVWSKQVDLLSSQGFRVVTIELSNIGLNLKENGLIDLKSNEGIEFDAEMSMQVLKGLRLKGPIAVVGHSRGGAVASVVAKKLLEKNKKVISLKLFSPYVRYIWSKGVYSDSVLLWWLENYPGLMGSQLVSSSEHGKVQDAVIDLPLRLKQTGYAYVLKGLQPPKSNSEENLQFETAETILEIQKQHNTKLDVTIVGAENDKKLAPMSALNELQLSGVELSFLEGEEYSHYWPLDHLPLANELITSGF